MEERRELHLLHQIQNVSRQRWGGEKIYIIVVFLSICYKCGYAPMHNCSLSSGSNVFFTAMYIHTVFLHSIAIWVCPYSLSSESTSLHYCIIKDVCAHAITSHYTPTHYQSLANVVTLCILHLHLVKIWPGGELWLLSCCLATSHN